MGRAAFALRAVVLARSVAELVEGLRALAEGREAPNLRTARVNRRDPARIAFLFTGQGAQYLGMGRALYEREPVFRRALDECAAGLQGAIERPLLELLFDPEAPAKRLDDTGFTRRAFAIEYRWRSFDQLGRPARRGDGPLRANRGRLPAGVMPRARPG